VLSNLLRVDEATATTDRNHRTGEVVNSPELSDFLLYAEKPRLLALAFSADEITSGNRLPTTDTDLSFHGLAPETFLPLNASVMEYGTLGYGLSRKHSDFHNFALTAPPFV